MRKLWKLAIVTGAAMSAALVAAAPAAQAAPLYTGYGWDGSPNVIVGAGSDTTYEAMINITKLYQEGSLSGCLHNTGAAIVPVPGPPQNSCKTPLQPNNLSNYQGDTVAQANAVGSGGGINALNVNTASDGNDHLGTVNPLPNPSRLTDTGTETIGSPDVTDPAATTADIGKSVSGVGIPVNTYIGPGTTAGSIKLSSAPDQQFDINATASGAQALTIKQYFCVGVTTHHAPDFARSSRGPNTTGGSAPCANELLADTFWGYAQDGVEVIGFNTHGGYLDSVAGASTPGVAAGHLTGQDLFNIWNCSGGTGTASGVSRTDGTGGLGTVVVTNGSATVQDDKITPADFGHGVTGTGIPANTFVGTVTNLTSFKLSSSPTSQVDVLATAPGTSVTIGSSQRVRWSDVIQNLPGGPGGPNDADIQPWGMNTSSGTFATYQTYVVGHSTAPAGWSPNNAACVKKLTGGGLPLENDIKPLINDPAVLGTGSSADNPENWMWWGSFGVFNQFPFTSQFTRGGTPFVATQARINGTLAGFGNILDRSWAISRTLYHITRKADADCVKATGSTTTCDFPNHIGPAILANAGGNPTSGGTDLNVTGGASGVSGSIREFTRMLCRQLPAQNGLDPITGANYNAALTSAINNAGFTIIKSTSRTPGSRCDISS